jgi:hypothetical protein
VQGTIDMRHIGDLLDGLNAVSTLAPDIWTEANDSLLRNWFQRYLDEWLIPHQNPRSERASENNHGNYFDVQYISILKYLKR